MPPGDVIETHGLRIDAMQDAIRNPGAGSQYRTRSQRRHHRGRSEATSSWARPVPTLAPGSQALGFVAVNLPVGTKYGLSRRGASNRAVPANDAAVAAISA